MSFKISVERAAHTQRNEDVYIKRKHKMQAFSLLKVNDWIWLKDLLETV